MPRRLTPTRPAVAMARVFTMTARTSPPRLLTTVFIAVSCLTPLTSSAHTQGTSTVAGCITDTTGQPLPGVTVDVGGNGTHRIVRTDASGCYTVPDVPAGSYFVFARLQGFVSVTHDNLNVTPGQPQNIDLRLRVAGMCECITFPNTVAKLWDAADAVVRVRLTNHDPDNPERKYRASVLSSWKRGFLFNTTEALTFLRFLEGNECEPYAVGQDFVLFLKWSSADQVWVRMSSGEGTVAAFAVENGRIHSAPIAAYVGMDTEQLTNQLASMAAR
jgi:hypothetical protein